MNFNTVLIDFFKKHNIYEEKMFTYLANNSELAMPDYEELEPLVGFFAILDSKRHIVGMNLKLPYVKNLVTAMDSIHELVHGVEFYHQLGKKYPDSLTIEALPLLYSKIFILENNDPKLTAHGAYLDSIILNSDSPKYQFGLAIRDELLKNYNYDMGAMQKMVKKLAKTKWTNK